MMRKIIKKRRHRIILVVLSLVVSLWLLILIVAWSVPLGDFAPVKPVPSLSKNHSPLEPIFQTEKHTCGLLALSAIYRSYGLSPGERRLRARLGVDRASLVFDTSSTGCIQPDIFRVLGQDGIDYVNFPTNDGSTTAKLQSHLDAGNLALALICRRETGNLHWLVLSKLTEGQVTLCDSLQHDLYSEPWATFQSECLVELLFLSPRLPGAESASVARYHYEGMKAMYASYQRMRTLPYRSSPSGKSAANSTPEKGVID